MDRPRVDDGLDDAAAARLGRHRAEELLAIVVADEEAQLGEAVLHGRGPCQPGPARDRAQPGQVGADAGDEAVEEPSLGCEVFVRALAGPSVVVGGGGRGP